MPAHYAKFPVTEYVESLQVVDISSLAPDARRCPVCLNDFGVTESTEDDSGPNNVLDAFSELPFTTRDPWHDPVALDKCGHVFGKSCIATSLDGTPTCPLCRDDLYWPVFLTEKKRFADSLTRRQIRDCRWDELDLLGNRVVILPSFIASSFNAAWDWEIQGVCTRHDFGDVAPADLSRAIKELIATMLRERSFVSLQEQRGSTAHVHREVTMSFIKDLDQNMHVQQPKWSRSNTDLRKALDSCIWTSLLIAFCEAALAQTYTLVDEFLAQERSHIDHKDSFMLKKMDDFVEHFVDFFGDLRKVCDKRLFTHHGELMVEAQSAFRFWQSELLENAQSSAAGLEPSQATENRLRLMEIVWKYRGPVAFPAAVYGSDDDAFCEALLLYLAPLPVLCINTAANGDLIIHIQSEQPSISVMETPWLDGPSVIRIMTGDW